MIYATSSKNVKNQKGGYGMKAINNAAKNKETLTCACNNCDPKDVCYLYDIETINRVKEYRRIKEIKETDFITDTLLEALYFDLEQVTDHQMAKVEEIVMGCEK